MEAVSCGLGVDEGEIGDGEADVGDTDEALGVVEEGVEEKISEADDISIAKEGEMNPDSEGTLDGEGDELVNPRLIRPF